MVERATHARLEAAALAQVTRWLKARRRHWQAAGKRLEAVIAFGPVVQHVSGEELDLLEVVTPLAEAVTEDVTEQVPTDEVWFGRIHVTTLSPELLDAALATGTPLTLELLQRFRPILDRVNVSGRLEAARRRLRSA